MSHGRTRPPWVMGDPRPWVMGDPRTRPTYELDLPHLRSPRCARRARFGDVGGGLRAKTLGKAPGHVFARSADA